MYIYITYICIYICTYIIYIYVYICIYIYIYMYIYYIYIYIYTYIYIYIREKHPWTSDTFKKMLLLKVTLPYEYFSRHFIYFFFCILLYSFIIDNAKATCLFFRLHDLFQIAQSIIC